MFLTACLACLAAAIAMPVAATAKRDKAPSAPAAANPGPGANAGAGIVSLWHRVKPGKGDGTPKPGSGQGTPTPTPSPAPGAGKPGNEGKPGNGHGEDKPGGGKPGRGHGHGHHGGGKPGHGDGDGDPGSGGGQPGGGAEEPAEPGGGDGGVPVDSTPSPPAVVATTPALAAPIAPATPPAAAVPVTATPAPTSPAPQTPRASDSPGAPVRDRAPRGGSTPDSIPSTGTGPVPGTPFGVLAAAAVGTGASSPRDGAQRTRPESPKTVTRTVVRTVQRAVEVVPGFLWALIAGLGAISLLATAASSFLAGRARRLGRQRAALLQDVGLLQEALLPEAPAQIAGAAAASVAYRAATSGPAGGDFYDVFALDEERLGIIVGRVSASGRRALGVTALIRHILRAYLEGGLQPRNALQVGADVLERHLGPDYACATVAVYDRATSRLTYAGAGMPAPIVLGSTAFEPVTSCAAPPIGMGVATGTRQTSVALPAGATACLYTDGVLDGRLDGGRYGYRRAWHALENLDEGSDAEELLDRVAAESDTSVEDMAAVLLRVDGGAVGAMAGGDRRLEELELGRRELDGERPGLFLRDCGVPTATIPAMVDELRETATRLGGAVLRVRFGPGVPEAEAGLRTMEMLSAAAGPSGARTSAS